MALQQQKRVDGTKYYKSSDLARYQWAWNDTCNTSIQAAAATETLLVLDQILGELKVLNARLGCPNFLGIPRSLRDIARDANRRNRRVDEAGKAKRRATRLANKR